MEAEEDDVDKNNNRRGPISRTVYEYADVATTHGIYYIFETGRLLFERIFWIIVVILALTFAIGLSVSAYDNWKTNPVLTSVGTTGYPIEKIKFPSITICPQGSANQIIDAALFKQFERYLEQKNKDILELSEQEIKNEGIAFLSTVYPGATRPPTKLVRMLGSPGLPPDKSLEADAVLNPEDGKQCKSTNSSKTELKCPDGFVRINELDQTSRSCWHFKGANQKTTRQKGIEYCEGLLHDNEWRFFTIQYRKDWEVIWNILNTGKNIEYEYPFELKIKNCS